MSFWSTFWVQFTIKCHVLSYMMWVNVRQNTSIEFVWLNESQHFDPLIGKLYHIMPCTYDVNIKVWDTSIEFLWLHESRHFGSFLILTAIKCHVLSYDMNKCKTKHSNWICMTAWKPAFRSTFWIHSTIKYQVIPYDVNKCKTHQLKFLWLHQSWQFGPLFWYTVYEMPCTFLSGE